MPAKHLDSVLRVVSNVMQSLHLARAPQPASSLAQDALPAELLGWPGTPSTPGCTFEALTSKHALRLPVHTAASPSACFSSDALQHAPADSCDTTAPSTPSPRPATVRSSDTPSSLHPSEHSSASVADHLAALSFNNARMPTPTEPAPCETLAVHASWTGRCYWRYDPPSVITGLMGASHLHDVLDHLPMDARHWNQLEQLLEEGRLEMFLIMVFNYLHYEDPTKWNKLEKHVMNPAGYLNKNIGQKVGMLAVCPDMVDAMHALRCAAPETAANVDGRTLQYMFDNLSRSQIRACCEYLHAVFDQTWPLRCENPRMLLHAKVKSFVAQAHQYDQQQAAAVGHYPATVPPQAPQPQPLPAHKLSLMFPPPMGQSGQHLAAGGSRAMLFAPHQQQHVQQRQQQHHHHPQLHPQLAMPKATAGYS